MNAAEIANALKPAVAALPSNFMLDGATYAKGGELGFEGMRFLNLSVQAALHDARLPAQVDMAIWDAFQIPYSALQREHEAAIAKASAAGAGIVIRGGVSRGMPGP